MRGALYKKERTQAFLYTRGPLVRTLFPYLCNSTLVGQHELFQDTVNLRQAAARACNVLQEIMVQRLEKVCTLRICCQ